MNSEFMGHQSDPSLNDHSSAVLRQYGSPRDCPNLNHSESPKFQVHDRVWHATSHSGRAAYLKGPLDHFRALLQNPDDPVLLRVPYAKSFQPSAALIALQNRSLSDQPPIVPDLFPSGAPIGERGMPLPIPIAKQLADLWAELGRREQDDQLIASAHQVRSWVENLGQRAMSLFTPEEFFIEEELPMTTGPFRDESLGITCADRACFTSSGFNSGLGAIQMADVQFRAFGPQTKTLTDCSGFGIRGVQSSSWAQCFGQSDAWVSLVPTLISPQEICFEIKWVGIETLWLSFYVLAKSCSLEDGTEFFPRNLHRFQGRSQKILFDRSVSLESSESLELQVIPLAGTNCYWNSTFLTAFKFNSSVGGSSFVIKRV